MEITIQQWETIKDNPPPYGEVIILCNKDTVCVGKLIRTDTSGHNWELFVNNQSWMGYRNFTHWMKLPTSVYEE